MKEQPYLESTGSERLTTHALLYIALLLNIATALRLNMTEKAKFRYTSQGVTDLPKGMLRFFWITK